MTSGWPLFAVLAALKGFMGVANGEELPELRSQTHPNTSKHSGSSILHSKSVQEGLAEDPATRKHAR